MTCLAWVSGSAQPSNVVEKAGAGSPPAADKVSRLGDPAPTLSVKEWVTGKPVVFKPGTNIYVLEFWAALSPASRAVVPALNELQNEFKDQGVVLVAIADDPPDKVREFATGVKLEYTVAADDRRATARKYMVAFGQNGIPHAFIIGRDGTVIWHGHPLGLKKALDAILAGRYDLQRAIVTDAGRAELDGYRLLARQGDAKAEALGRKLLADRTNNAVELCDFAYRIVTDVSNTNRDFALAEAALDQAGGLASEKTPLVDFTRGVVVFEQGKQADGIAIATKAISLLSDTNEIVAYSLRLKIMEERMKAEEKNKRRGTPRKL